MKKKIKSKKNQDRWPSGRRRTIGNRVYLLKGTVGSNPTLSANKKIHPSRVIFL